MLRDAAASGGDRWQQRRHEPRQQGGILLPGHQDLRRVVQGAWPQGDHRLRAQVAEGGLAAG